MVRSRSDLALLSLAGVAAACIGVLAPTAVAWDQAAIYAPAVATAAIACGTLYMLHTRNWDAFSPLGLICLFYLATYTVGGVYFALAVNHPLRRLFDTSDITVATWLGCIGLGALVVGYASNLLGFVQDLL